MLLCVTGFPSLLMLNNISLYLCATFLLAIHPLMVIWLFPSLALWWVLQWIWVQTELSWDRTVQFVLCMQAHETKHCHIVTLFGSCRTSIYRVLYSFRKLLGIGWHFHSAFRDVTVPENQNKMRLVLGGGWSPPVNETSQGLFLLTHIGLGALSFFTSNHTSQQWVYDRLSSSVIASGQQAGQHPSVKLSDSGHLVVMPQALATSEGRS